MTKPRCRHREFECAACGQRGCGVEDCDGRVWEILLSAGESEDVACGTCLGCGGEREFATDLRLVPDTGERATGRGAPGASRAR